VLQDVHGDVGEVDRLRRASGALDPRPVHLLGAAAGGLEGGVDLGDFLAVVLDHPFAAEALPAAHEGDQDRRHLRRAAELFRDRARRIIEMRDAPLQIDPAVAWSLFPFQLEHRAHPAAHAVAGQDEAA
jgi:hypothetical protein